jgi:hypothetical protein
VAAERGFGALRRGVYGGLLMCLPPGVPAYEFRRAALGPRLSPVAKIDEADVAAGGGSFDKEMLAVFRLRVRE